MSLLRHGQSFSRASSPHEKRREKEREKSSEEKDRPFEFQEREQGCSFFNESLPLFRSRNSRTPRADRNQGRHSADNVASTIACWTRKTWQPSGSVGRGGGKKKKGGEGKLGWLWRERSRRIREYCEYTLCMQKRDKWHGLLRERLIEWGSMPLYARRRFQIFPLLDTKNNTWKLTVSATPPTLIPTIEGGEGGLKCL